MRFIVSCVVLAVAASSASADSGRVIVQNGTSEPVKAALASAGVGTVSTRTVEADCASDPSCIAKLGNELTASQVLVVTVGTDDQLTFMLVDVKAQLLLGTRDVTIKSRQIKMNLATVLKKFIEESPLERAKTLFAEGNQHYNLGEFPQALERYKLAYRVKPLPAFQFNIAQCHRKLGQHKESIAMYQAYLAEVPDASNKPLVESLIEESRKAIRDADAAAAAQERGRIELEKKRAEEQRKAKEAEATIVTETSKTEQARIAAERERERTYNRHPARTWMLITGGVGVAAIGVGAYFGLQSRSAQQSFDDGSCGDPNQQRGADALEECRDLRETGQRSALFSNIFIGAGAAVAVVSAVVFVLDPGNVERPTESRATVSVSPRSIQVVLKW